MTDTVLTTAIITVGSIVTTLLGLVFARLGVVAKSVDGNNTEQIRQIAALTTEIGRLREDPTATTPTTTTPATAPVSITQGQVVTPKVKASP